MAGFDTDSVVRNILTREVSRFGVSRVPFWLGSRRSTGIDIREFIEGDFVRLGPVIERDGRFGLTATKKPLSLSKLIRLRINPQQIEIVPFVRIAEAKTAAGRTYYHWVNDEGRAIDLYELKVSGVTGNLLPGSTNAKHKLYLWMKLRELTYEPRVFVKTEVIEEQVRVGPEFSTVRREETKEVDNEFFILMRTVGLPMVVLFIGFFKTPITFTERADNQYSHEWSFIFTITDMFPRLEEMSNVASFAIFPDLIDRVLGD